MLPTLHSGDIIVGWRSEVREGDIVVAERDGREVIKRVSRIENRRYYLIGDNPDHSTDSRQYGFLNSSAILGVMKLHLPIATNAPTARTLSAQYYGWIAALVMALFAVIHLFRIDTFVPELDGALFGGETTAAWIAVLIVSMEVFAIPFLLRMKLSPLARLKSGTFAIFVPLFWLLVAIWSAGQLYSTSQLGEFQTLPSSWFLIVFNAIWLGFNFYTVYLLQPSWLKQLRKR